MKFPFISLYRALILLRISVAGIFLAHAIVRIFDGTIERFAGFLSGKGFPFALIIVWLITAYEIIGGVLLIIGKLTKWISLGFIILLLSGIIIIHVANGWFVGEHGSGGIEYSFILIIALVVIAATNKKSIFRR
ncbi:MAG: DoxX family protein [Taibaiella sp.]|jgi:putative oxidoreductase